MFKLKISAFGRLLPHICPIICRGELGLKSSKGMKGQWGLRLRLGYFRSHIALMCSFGNRWVVDGVVAVRLRVCVGPARGVHFTELVTPKTTPRLTSTHFLSTSYRVDWSGD
jgi:hypothetical protein